MQTDVMTAKGKYKAIIAYCIDRSAAKLLYALVNQPRGSLISNMMQKMARMK